MKNLRNKVALASIKKLMAFCKSNKEKTIAIKERLQNRNLNGFCYLDGWLDVWKIAYSSCCRKNDYFLDGKVSGINQRILTGKHFEP